MLSVSRYKLLVAKSANIHSEEIIVAGERREVFLVLLLEVVALVHEEQPIRTYDRS
jgi:hypothetical protein